MKGLLRCWVSTLIREISRIGCHSGEVLLLLDEASCLNGLSPIQDALVKGRSSGLRMLLAYQSDSQIQAAFKDQKTLLYDNADAQIYPGASSYETAERISKSCGDWTQVVSSYNENESRSIPGGQSGAQTSRGSTTSLSVQGRNLIRPEEVLTLNRAYLICFVRGMAPICDAASDLLQRSRLQPRNQSPEWAALVVAAPCSRGLRGLGIDWEMNMSSEPRRKSVISQIIEGIRQSAIGRAFAWAGRNSEQTFMGQLAAMGREVVNDVARHVSPGDVGQAGGTQRAGGALGTHTANRHGPSPARQVAWQAHLGRFAGPCQGPRDGKGHGAGSRKGPWDRTVTSPGGTKVKRAFVALVLLSLPAGVQAQLPYDPYQLNPYMPNPYMPNPYGPIPPHPYIPPAPATAREKRQERDKACAFLGPETSPLHRKLR